MEHPPVSTTFTPTSTLARIAVKPFYALFGNGTQSGFFHNTQLRAYYISLNGGAYEAIIPAIGSGNPETIDCTGTATPTTCNAADLASTKVDSPTIIDNDANGILSDGDEITYTVEVINNGTAFANQVNFVDDPSATDPICPLPA